jgi:hypothetical protein
MMMRKSHIQQTALALTLVYLFLSAFMTVGAGGHAATHEHGGNHAAQHASFICNWMCAASSFVHSADPHLRSGVHPSFEKLTVYTEPFISNLSAFSFYIRPPPVSIS